ncbi:hypothetical protein [Roseateles sp.]|uniref:hypothetical protein n=1 Tax=Roseateles sp. TaxID=1971397 RepID=UPI0025E06097|nr:hypothetical protein [Roseateles sp.]MBV8037130.1 hypothetical protein [Roseateles sp.]
MSRFWRIALTWLLAVALPIQGYAAQTMLLCGPAGHQGGVMEERAAHGHDHARMIGGEAHVMGDAGVAVHDADEAQPAHAKHAGKCSLCSACCNAVAIMASAVSIAVAPPDLPEVPTVQVARDRVMVGGLDRPPRSSRA